MPLPPTLTPEQRQAALEKAAAARRERAELKDRLKMGTINLKELFATSEGNEVVGKMIQPSVNTAAPVIATTPPTTVIPAPPVPATPAEPSATAAPAAKPGATVIKVEVKKR